MPGLARRPARTHARCRRRCLAAVSASPRLPGRTGTRSRRRRPPRRARSWCLPCRSACREWRPVDGACPASRPPTFGRVLRRRPGRGGRRESELWFAEWSLPRLLRDDPPDDVPDRFDLTVPAPDQVSDHAGPAGLVERANRRAVVAVEVLAEDQVVVPCGIVLHDLGPAETGPLAVVVLGENRDQPV